MKNFTRTLAMAVAGFGALCAPAAALAQDAAPQRADAKKGSFIKVKSVSKSKKAAAKANEFVEPLQLPVYFDFNADNRADDWTYLDLDGNGDGWKFFVYEKKGVYNYAAVSGFSYEGNCNDVMMTKRPISMKAGKHTIEFMYEVYNNWYTEDVDIYIGTTDDVEKMTKVAELRNCNNEEEWKTFAKTFDVPANGNYYLAFVGCSQASDDYRRGLIIDNLIVSEGDNVCTPDVEAVTLESTPMFDFPVDTPMTFKINTMLGRGDVASATLTYTINDGQPVSERFEFNPPIPAGSEQEVTFKTPADLSADNVYNVTYAISDVVSSQGVTEKIIDCNAASHIVVNFGTTDVPFVTDYGVEPIEDHPESWYSVGGTWEVFPWEGSGFIFGKEHYNFYSCGVNLKAGVTYRFALTSNNGDNLGSGYAECMYHISYGKAGSSVDTWKDLVYYDWETKQYQKDWETNTFAFTPEEDGVYQFGIIPVLNGDIMRIRNLTVEVNPTDEVWVTNVDGVKVLPVSQTGSFNVNATCYNKGMENTDILLTATVNEQVVGTYTVKDAVPAAENMAVIKCSLPEAVADNDYEIVVTPSIPGKAEGVSVRTASYTLRVDKKILAYEDFGNGKPYGPYGPTNGNTFSIGNLFEVQCDDDLTGITLGWVDYSNDADGEHLVNVYRVDDVNNIAGIDLENPVLSTNITKSNMQTGWESYTLPKTQLTTGFYLATVNINTRSFSYLYKGAGYYLRQAASTAPFKLYTSYGCVGLRLEFAGESGGVDNIAADSNFGAYTLGNTLYLKGAVGTTAVYDVAGRCVYTGTADTVALPAAGIYIVANNGHNVKVVNR